MNRCYAFVKFELKVISLYILMKNGSEIFLSIFYDIDIFINYIVIREIDFTINMGNMR